MNKAKYFKIIGVVELVAFAFGLLTYLLYSLLTLSETFGSTQSTVTFFIIIGLLVFFGPSLGILFITVGQQSEVIEILVNGPSKE